MKERQGAISVAVLVVMLKLVSGVVLMTDPAMTRLVIISDTGPMCSIYTNRPEIRRLVLEADPRLVREVNPLDMGAVVDSCRRNGLTKHGRRHSTQPMQQGGFIYPGTKWCGPGSIASDYDDLGEYREEDRCCRDHDSCPEQLAPGQCLYGLCNESPFTRSHCDCDTRFKRCLQSLNTDTANTLGAIFFNVAQITCFTEAKPCPQQYLEDEVEENSLCPEMEFRSSGPFSPLMPFY